MVCEPAQAPRGRPDRHRQERFWPDSRVSRRRAIMTASSGAAHWSLHVMAGADPPPAIWRADLGKDVDGGPAQAMTVWVGHAANGAASVTRCLGIMAFVVGPCSPIHTVTLGHVPNIPAAPTLARRDTTSRRGACGYPAGARPTMTRRADAACRPAFPNNPGGKSLSWPRPRMPGFIAVLPRSAGGLGAGPAAGLPNRDRPDHAWKHFVTQLSCVPWEVAANHIRRGMTHRLGATRWHNRTTGRFES